MGLSKAGWKKRKVSGGRRKQHRKKRAYERARAAAQTKLAPRKVKMMRVRGGRYKARALRLNFANFAWRSENFSAKTRLLDVVYHPANYEYVRTKTLTKSAIVTVDATPFRVWYRNHFNVDLAEGEEKKLEFKEDVTKEERQKIEARQREQKLPENIATQFAQGKLFAIVTAKPGQVGRADGYILEEEELDFYIRKMKERKQKK